MAAESNLSDNHNISPLLVRSSVDVEFMLSGSFNATIYGIRSFNMVRSNILTSTNEKKKIILLYHRDYYKEHKSDTTIWFS